MVHYITFSKMSGAGNDFVVIDNRQNLIVHPARTAQKLCDRRFGIGADGLLLVEKSLTSDFAMKYYNSDGSYGGMCGNGGRCIAMFAFRTHIVTGRIMKFDALGYTYTAEIIGQNVVLSMKDPVETHIGKTLLVDGFTVRYHTVDTGTAQCVIFLDENPELLAAALEDAKVHYIGKKIRFHETFAPGGTNVNFVQTYSNNLLAQRTYERGVEDETLACGTGAVASSILAYRVKQLPSPVSVRVRSGEILRVNFSDDGNGHIGDITLEGSAEIVYEGTIVYDAGQDMIIPRA